ncbi:methanethiol S-methyltransferase [Actinoplanes sp. CA-142083]|uniref:methanethiol S-methyltransferase n=1 Tax=Actinoplanes sp. CA-142083 TaxID=3239903 RepID=UPI003D8FA424
MVRKIYAVVVYALFAAAFLYTVGFLADAVVPKGIDDGTVRPAWQAILVDLALLGAFAGQHTVMARPWFKSRWTRIIPPSVERSTFVLAATALLILLLWLWQPLPTSVWTVGPGWARALLWTLYLAGWGFLFFATFALGHFDLFGVRQALSRKYSEPEFREPSVYRYVQHPIMVGFLIAFWAAPDMSAGRLLFAGASTAYIMVGVRFEEHDLKQQLGAPYADYAARVPRFIPRPPARTVQGTVTDDRAAAER